MWVVRHRRIFFAISGILILAALFSFFRYGFNLGIDFAGGAILEVEYLEVRPDDVEINRRLASLALGSVAVQPVGERGLILRLKDIDQEAKEAVLTTLTGGDEYPLLEKRFSSIGPVVSRELGRRGLTAVILVLLLIILFIAFAFRKVSRVKLPGGGLSSWKYGVTAFVTLLHDLVVPAGLFVWLGRTGDVELDVLFLTGLLTILGVSVHDTIVVFDRIRENLRLRTAGTFEETVGYSLTQTFVRSVNTSLTTILALLALYFLGAESTRHFTLLMAVGIFIGTYSSIFLASPLLVAWEKRSGLTRR